MGQEEEKQPKEAHSEAKAAPEARSMTPPEEEMATFDDKPPMNTGLVLVWITAVIAILLTAYFWWSGRNIADMVATEKAKTDQIVAEISLPGMKETSRQAQDFKASVSALADAKAERFTYSTFLPTLFGKMTKESSISALSIASDGKLNVTAKAKSYRGAAEFATALSSWDGLTGVDMGSVSLSVSDGGTAQALFSLSAQIAKETLTASQDSIATGGAQ